MPGSNTTTFGPRSGAGCAAALPPHTTASSASATAATSRPRTEYLVMRTPPDPMDLMAGRLYRAEAEIARCGVWARTVPADLSIRGMLRPGALIIGSAVIAERCRQLQVPASQLSQRPYRLRPRDVVD